jgi:hypothetical protein
MITVVIATSKTGKQKGPFGSNQPSKSFLTKIPLPRVCGVRTCFYPQR